MRPLTATQLLVLRSLADGKTCAEFAAECRRSHETIKRQRVELRVKLGARNAPHAVAVGFREGLLQ